MPRDQGSGGRRLVGWIVILLFAGIILEEVIERSDEPEAGDDDPAVEMVADAAYAADARRADWPPLLADAAPAGTPVSTSNYYVVLDGSGSMRKSHCSGGTSKIEAAVAALGHFIRAIPAEANLGLAVFDQEGTSERVPLGTGNRPAVEQALATVRASGGTPLQSAIELGYERLVDQGRAQLGYGEYHLVVVTDGQPDPRSEDPTPIVDRMLAESPVMLHTIGFCIGTDHVLNQPGRSFYAAADNPQELQQGLSAVLAEAPTFDVTSFESK